MNEHDKRLTAIAWSLSAMAYTDKLIQRYEEIKDIDSLKSIAKQIEEQLADEVHFDKYAES